MDYYNFVNICLMIIKSNLFEVRNKSSDSNIERGFQMSGESKDSVLLVPIDTGVLFSFFGYMYIRFCSFVCCCCF